MRKKRETSKTVLAIVLTVCFILAGIVIYGWLALGRDDASGLVGVILAPAATCIGFYSWKAKAENQIKLKKIYNDYKEEE